MKHYNIVISLTLLMSMASTKVFAYNIAVANADGKTIYYNLSGTNAEVTYLDYNRLDGFKPGYGGSVVIPNKVTYNGTSYNVTSIGIHAFDSCSGLTSVTIPNSVTSIGGNAFYNCSGLKSVILPDNLTTIGGYAFSGCSGLTSVILPDNLTTIGGYAFEKCTGLISMTIPNSVTHIGERAFKQTYLSSFTIGTGVLSIGNFIFSDGSKPIKVIWLTNTPPSGYYYADGVLNYVSNDLYTSLSNKTVYPFLSSMFEVDGIKYVPVSPSERTCDAIDCPYNESAENVKICENVVHSGITLTVIQVKPYVCYHNPYIKDVELTFNNSLEAYSFYRCTGLRTASISNQGYIGASAFYGCTSLQTANISNQGYIGASAFYGCTNDGNDANFNISNNGDIRNSAFYKCKGLKTVTVNNIGYLGSSAFYGCSKLQSVELGQGITTIGYKAFSNCSELESIVIPDGVTSIGSSAFSSCSKMTSSKIGEGITKISSQVFYGCSSLIDVLIGTNVKTIDNSAFGRCSSLPQIYIPQNVTDIKDSVFYGCTNLSTVIMKDSETELSLGCNGSNPLFESCKLDSVYIGRNISYSTNSNKGYSPFYRNTSLRSIHITDKETEISVNEFYGCTNLKNVKIGNGVTDIAKRAFSGCFSLESFEFGSSTSSIGEEAFSDCTAMTRLVSHALVPPTCDTQALDDINKWICTLSVPHGYIPVYQQADQWKEFFFINDDVSGIKNVGSDAVVPTGYYQLNGSKSNAVRHGLNIIKMSDGTTKKVVVK